MRASRHRAQQRSTAIANAKCAEGIMPSASLLVLQGTHRHRTHSTRAAAVARVRFALDDPRRYTAPALHRAARYTAPRAMAAAARVRPCVIELVPR